MLTFSEFRNTFEKRGCDLDYSDLQQAYADYFHENVRPGDGVTVHYWTDAHACTVIRRTKDKLILQQDRAILDPNFKPDFIPGGFAGTVINQHEQTYTYERNPEGRIYEAFWSDRKGGWYADKCLHLTYGRHEFYDYNF